MERKWNTPEWILLGIAAAEALSNLDNLMSRDFDMKRLQSHSLNISHLIRFLEQSTHCRSFKSLTIWTFFVKFPLVHLNILALQPLPMSTKNNQCRLQGNWEITYYVEHGSLMETQNFNQYKEKDLLVCFIFPAVCLCFMVWNSTFLDCVDVLFQELHMVFKATFWGTL